MKKHTVDRTYTEDDNVDICMKWAFCLSNKGSRPSDDPDMTKDASRDHN
jgi:hypothetical protein